MSCSTSAYVQRLRDRLATKETSLEKAQAALDAALDAPILKYKFNSTEASQQAERRKLDELQMIVDSLQAEVDRLRREICGIGTHAIRLRRR